MEKHNCNECANLEYNEYWCTYYCKERKCFLIKFEVCEFFKKVELYA